ncbi:hypothetical protein DEU56DRAFT_918405 [Suillus clintonianus]|uniref:uncharacterized protein n=1 Tax=Suillus clintonianus TaxID=1904413 RepID=UPI001B87CE02|nr:uncharacterized protein DEU56DRAFT_918405 [Suillus clintonianus]KAG2120262.1 hypothetical protein DEU56DRAFT_918405 [Suillus clintonianus]
MESHSRLQLEARRKAKDQALEKPVWQTLQSKPRKHKLSTTDDVRPAQKWVKTGNPGHEPKVTAPPAQNKKDSKNRNDPERPLPSSASDFESEVEPSIQPKKKSKMAHKAAAVSVDSSEPNSDASEHSMSDASDNEESDMELAESVAKALFGEIPTIANKTSSSSQSSKTPPPPIWGSQLRPLNARERKHAAETPLWDSVMTSSSFVSQAPTPRTDKGNRSFSESTLAGDEAEDDHSPTLDIKSEPDSTNDSDAEPHPLKSKAHSLQEDPISHLVYTKTGSVRLMDQNVELRKVIQRGILEVKAYIAFEHGYPEIAARNVYSREILLKAAQYHNTAPIEKRMRIDDEYLSALSNLIDARASLFRSDIKDVASKSILGYFRLGSFGCDGILDRLLANHSYVFPQTFDAQGLPSPNRKKLYQSQPFGQRFCDIARNKGGRPEIPIPMLAMVCTAIRAILLAKKNKSSDDFKFTGNQFFDIYNHHVVLLERILTTAPVKFHKMMADIYEEVHRFRHSITGVYDQDDGLAFLDLEGMEDE